MPRLPEADAITIHRAIHTPGAMRATLTNGLTLPIFVSQNGSRRCDLPLGAFSQNAKLMAQSLSKSSDAAARARAGAKITHVIPLGKDGQHITTSHWGMIEGDKVTKYCYVIQNPNAPPEDPARTKYGHLRSECTFLHCPFEQKEQAKSAGACWDGEGDGCRRQWYVPPGLSLARFARWLPSTTAPAHGAPAASSSANEADVDGVEVAGARTWAERDAELRKHAVPLDESDDDAAEAHSRPLKRAKPEPNSPPTTATSSPAAADAPASTGSTSSPAPRSSKGSLKQKADELGAALGLAPGASLPEVARAACEATEVDASNKSLAAQIAASHDVIFGVAAPAPPIDVLVAD